MKESEKEEKIGRNLGEISKRVSKDLLDSLEKHTNDFPDTDDFERMRFSATMAALTYVSARCLKNIPVDHLEVVLKNYVDKIIETIIVFKKIETVFKEIEKEGTDEKD